MKTITMTWPDLPTVTVRTTRVFGNARQCAIRCHGQDCINVLLLPDKLVAVIRAAENLPDAAVRAFGRTVSLHQGAIGAGHRFPPGGSAGVVWHAPTEIPWGHERRVITQCTIHEGAGAARVFLLSDPVMPIAGVQFGAKPTDDLLRSVALVLLEHRARLIGIEEARS